VTFFDKIFGRKRPLSATPQPARAHQPAPAPTGTRVSGLANQLDSPDEGARVNAAMGLSRCSGDAVVTALMKGLKDSSPKVRACSAESLRLLRNPRAVDALLEVLMNDAQHDPAYYATKALGTLATTKAIEGMILALQQRKGDISELALQLGELRASGSVDALMGALADNDRERVSAYARRHAVMALQKIGDRRAVPSLRLALGDADGGVRERAQCALSAFGESCMPLVHIDGCIVHYQTQEDADRDFEIVLEALKATPEFGYDVATVKTEETYALIVTSNRSDIRQSFREAILPKLRGEDLEFSNEEKLPRFLGAGGRLVRHEQLS